MTVAGKTTCPTTQGLACPRILRFLGPHFALSSVVQWWNVGGRPGRRHIRPGALLSKSPVNRASVQAVRVVQVGGSFFFVDYKANATAQINQ